MKHPIFLIFLSGIILFSGCSTIENAHRQKKPVMTAYLENRPREAEEKIRDKISSTKNTGDELMWRLEAGSLGFNTGKYTDSIREFAKAESLIADYDSRAVLNAREAAAETAGALTNMNALPYRGWCRDRILIPVFKAFSYLGKGDEEGFRTELFRLRENQAKVLSDYKKYFKEEQKELEEAKKNNPREAEKCVSEKDLEKKAGNAEFSDGLKQVKAKALNGYSGFLNPFAVFLSGFGYLRDGDYENALVDFTRLYKARPDSSIVRRYYVTSLRLAERTVPENLKSVKPFDFPLNRDNVLVVFANGRGPAFKQIALYFPLMTAWPMCEYYPAEIQSLPISAGGKSYRTETLADMDGILSQEFQERLPGIVTRIVLSTAIKETAYYGGLTAVAVSDMDPVVKAITMIGIAVTGAAYRAAVNTADTRTWEILPKEYQIAQFPMPADRTVSIAGTAVRLPPEAKSAVLYVNAPSRMMYSIQILPIKSK